jgi:hypothetical protein
MAGQKYFSPAGFRIDIDLLPSLSDYVQKVEVPSLGIVSTKVDNPFVPVNVSGDRVEFDDLIVAFKLDADLQNYSDVIEWFTALGFPEHHETYKSWFNRNGKMKGIGTLTFLNDKYKGIAKYSFEDVTPNYITGFEMKTDINNIDYVSVAVRFSYTKSNFSRI